MEEAKNQLYQKEKHLKFIDKLSKALEWLFFLL